jgi:hypothetical protein
MNPATVLAMNLAIALVKPPVATPATALVMALAILLVIPLVMALAMALTSVAILGTKMAG